MVRKQLTVAAFASLAGMLGYSAILPAGPLAVVTDSDAVSCISEDSTVNLLTVEASKVTLNVKGSCAGTATTTPTGLVDLTTRAVDEGTSITLDLGLDVIVKLPFELTATKSVLGQTPTVTDSKLTYWAPDPGTVSDAGGEDSFEYTIKDNSGNQVTKTITVPINSVDATVVVPITGDVCVNSATVTCKGALPDWPAGTLFYQYVDAGETHVWEVVYDKEINNEGQFLLFDGGLKTISISLKSNDFSLVKPCQLTQEILQQPIAYASVDVAASYQCGLEHGKKYFINIKSTLATRDPYTLTVY